MDAQYGISEWTPCNTPYTHTCIRSVVEIDMYGLQSVVCGWSPVLCEGAGKHCCLSIVWIFCMGCVQTDQSTTGCGDYLIVYPPVSMLPNWLDRDFLMLNHVSRMKIEEHV